MDQIIQSKLYSTKTPTVNNYYTLRTDNELERFVALANQIEKSVHSRNLYSTKVDSAAANARTVIAARNGVIRQVFCLDPLELAQCFYRNN